MDRGRLVAAGTVAELLAASPAVYVEVGDAAAATPVLEALAVPGGVRAEGTGLVVELDGSRPSDVAGALVRAGIALEAMTPRRRLEDVFLRLIEAPARPGRREEGDGSR
jgi:ABC-2 type transport system ATP-binding protein